MFSAGKTATEDLGNLLGISAHGSQDSSTGMLDDDLEAFKEINSKLKQANLKLQQELGQIEKNHRKEDVFNQKLIVKLQNDNEKLLKKLEEKSGKTTGVRISDSLFK